MEKYFPIIKVLFFSNILFLAMITFFVYFDVKSPGTHGLNPNKTIWTAEQLIYLYVLGGLATSTYLVTIAFQSTKSIADLKSRFLKNTKFKLIDKGRVIGFLIENQYTAQDKVYSKSLGPSGGNKSPTVIKIIVSTNKIELQLDRWSLSNFQMDKKYCEEINAFRTTCKDAIGEEVF